ncbi:MAG: DUF982 domain-containing protein [Shinella sp.]|uniref:DUF982 domain-containing protein n=1 Tax=Shinella sp. TaxID=1870904 RepID=UPI003C7708F5
MAQSWGKIITIEIDDTSHACMHVQSTEDAARYLLEHWTGQRTSFYRIAVQSCAKALKGEISDCAAYLCFMTAVREAQLALVTARCHAEADLFEAGIEQALAESVLHDTPPISHGRFWWPS